LFRQEHKEDAKAETEVRAEDDKTVVPIVADKAGDEAEPAEPEVPLTAAEGARAPRLGVGVGGMPAGALQARQGKALVSHLLAAVGALQGGLWHAARPRVFLVSRARGREAAEGGVE
jgi:hypothetical protein